MKGDARKYDSNLGENGPKGAWNRDEYGIGIGKRNNKTNPLTKKVDPKVTNMERDGAALHGIVYDGSA